MIKKNLHIIIISTVITLLPVVTGSIVPVFLAVLNLGCMLGTMWDPGNREQSHKAMRLVYFLCPFLSIYIAGVNFAIQNGLEFGVDVFTMVTIGVVFILTGNYLPKCKQNYTLGIKVPWVYTSEENWRKTHSFGGRLWVIGGFLLLISILFPTKIADKMILFVFFGMILAPTLYSYLFYRKELREGKALSTKARFGKSGKFSGVVMAGVFVFVGIMMFTGNIEYKVTEESLTINADYWDDTTIFFKNVEKIEYRENGVEGKRIGGFGSARLQMGTFDNDEFGYYTRYTYTKCNSAIVIITKNNEMVISAKTQEETKALFEKLKMNIR